MTDQEILLLAGMIKGISETVWHIAMIRVYAMSIQFAIWSLIFFVSWIATSFATVRFVVDYKKNRADDSYMGAWIAAVFAFLSLIAFSSFLSASVARAVAPEWYALQQIIYHLK